MPETGQKRMFWLTRWRWRIALGLAVLVAVAILSVWLGRDRIAGNLIDEQLAENGLEASYRIVSIGPQRQVIEDLVIGDPAAPDFTAERIVIDIEYGVFSASTGQVEVTGARIFGSYRNGEVSFGALDPLLLAETDEPAGLPDIDVRLIDARGLLQTDFGNIAMKLDGEGRLSDGFAGKLAATAPGLGVPDCGAQTATIYGDLTTPGGVPRFSGPVRLRNADCYGVVASEVDIAADLALDTDFAAVDGNFDLVASQIGGFGVRGGRLNGTAGLTWRDGTLTFQHDFAVEELSSPYGDLARLRADGLLRSAGDPSRSDWSARIEGEEVALPLVEGSSFSDARAAAEGTLAASLLTKLERNLRSAARGGRIAADVTVRQSEDGITILIPEARLRTQADDTLVALSRFNWSSTGRLTASLASGGEGLPSITGRMVQSSGSELVLRVEMEEYAAGADSLEVPQMLIRSRTDGSLEFEGLAVASGAIPGGDIDRLIVPIEGTFSPSGDLAVGRNCVGLRFDGLSYYDLRLGAQSLRLCPHADRPILAYDQSLRVDAQSEDLLLTGELAGSPVIVTSKNARFSFPEGFSLENLSARIGADGSSIRLSASVLDGEFANQIGGSFMDGTAKLDLVPLDLDELEGKWRYEDEILLVDQAAFRLTERTEEGQFPRFEPLLSRGAVLSLDGNGIVAAAELREPQSDRLILTTTVRHDLASGDGQADLAVPGVVFDDLLQPDQLSFLASGVVAEAQGVISGDGTVRWTADELTSTGSFSTERFDFAAAFGPVSAVRGTMRFSDLLAITTEPGQVLEVGSVNPGIEVLAGRVVYDLRDGQVLNVEDARWPFMGGELILRPVTLDYGEPGGARYVFELVGLDAATFVTQMELTNLGATGTFDGTIPVVFDTIGNGRIEGGLLISRPPGGNVAYIGELTYEDLGAMGNYAFQSLRSLDYSQMSVGLNGDLAGEIITNFQFDGISQGEGTTQNFVTRQLAKLPIRFKINVRSENFYELSTVVRSFFDPEYLGNPIDRGLFENRDGVLVPRGSEPSPSPPDPVAPSNGNKATRQDESPVQPPESEEMQ
ncbi:MAG: YdbH domain-containing protein [Erythrobacter sp.]|nr:YdbH domain-containing protein [Erythrobacter sp.]